MQPSWRAASSRSSCPRPSSRTRPASRGRWGVLTPRRLSLANGFLQGRHQVDDPGRCGGRFGRLGQWTALPLRLDDLGDRVRVAVGEVGALDVGAGHPVDQVLRLGDLLIGDFGRPRRQLGRVADLVGPAHRVQHDRLAAHPQQSKALPAGPGVLGDGHLRRALQRQAQPLVRLGRDLPVGLQVVALGELDRVDRLQRHEGLDLDVDFAVQGTGEVAAQYGLRS